MDAAEERCISSPTASLEKVEETTEMDRFVSAYFHCLALITILKIILN